MDTSEQYIKMCNCTEIQDGWEPKVGDLYTTEISIAYGEYKHYILFGLMDTGFIWLPRQDQLQEMAYPDGKMAIDQLGNVVVWFNHTARSYVWQFGESMEQLWLAFIMREKFSKKWDGKKWCTLDGKE